MGSDKTDDAGHFLFATDFVGSADFGEGPMNAPPNGGYASYVALYDEFGTRLWSKFLSGNISDEVRGAVIACDRVFLAGMTRGGLDAGGGPLSPPGQRTNFVMTFDFAGNFLAQAAVGPFREMAVELARSVGAHLELAVEEERARFGQRDGLPAWSAA